MVGPDRRTSALFQESASSDHERDGRPKSKDGPKNDMWSSMLGGVASGKRLPEKSILVLGGTTDSQKEFLDSLSNDSPTARKTLDRHSGKPPPIANQFALGYTYHDVLDADHEGMNILARLSIYLLTDPMPSFTPLLRPLITPQTLSNMLTVILLDWAHPWSWLRQLRDWIRLLRSLLTSLDDATKEALEEHRVTVRGGGRTGAFDGGGGSGGVTEGEVSIPLGPGEWDEALGIPLCVVCQNADKIQTLEKERAWKEEEFDFVLQFLRTVLLKHGASLVYTTPSVPSQLQTLIHSSLGIQSLLKKQPLKHNVIDRDKVLVPPNWDSWGKIRVLREGFDVEGVNEGWSIDIRSPLPTNPNRPPEPNGMGGSNDSLNSRDGNGALAVFEDTIRDVRSEDILSTGSLLNRQTSQSVEVESFDMQEFLAAQMELLERLGVDDEREQASKDKRRDPQRRSMGYRGEGDGRMRDSGVQIEEGGRVSEHIGPVQFNMGGIQVDADDMLKRLKLDHRRFEKRTDHQNERCLL
ncbi:hypothetical protein FGG08_001269 [Glutinoglossum americanum]|uniref:Dynein light intermediate chain n=1 Tax=Glutinoglossum americanum TaxID=1670608 RepID=A0A9P8L5H4_9PEZI|nr:hypothetical protein FGG08_001269 [Glutinoglossum americanum]